jgi:hypothetical protein
MSTLALAFATLDVVQAAEAQQEWAPRSVDATGSGAQYPRPVDSAHNLYDYYAYKAKHAGKLRAKHSRLANPELEQHRLSGRR